MRVWLTGDYRVQTWLMGSIPGGRREPLEVEFDLMPSAEGGR